MNDAMRVSQREKGQTESVCSVWTPFFFYQSLILCRTHSISLEWEQPRKNENNRLFMDGN